MLLYSVVPGGDFGVSIILFTILLRLVMYPLVKRQLHQTKLMRKMQPELSVSKKQTKGNRRAQSIQMMELYKRPWREPIPLNWCHVGAVTGVYSAIYRYPYICYVP